ncbi:uncharacterized protein ACA1_086310 [Acanthamoeba castellanii str. Neff]|uniref:Uncharacterized protein n=1 Tax=Acanthamoeba castellanii (strain ATCC 30010 / Neff) TaxID=1257118 RepID=L8HGV4_ACACF|nr:uncharacterized protein ACA1_086310 [Acanthamoeba castellanii str. Neff]ELR24400.1 hypothetical protein ACA1_086310 [Acanthamoeba castellanii str. Neff]
MSIVSGTGAVHLTDDVRSAVVAVSKRYNFTTTSASDNSSLFVPFCTLKFVDGKPCLTIDTVSATTPVSSSSSDSGSEVAAATWESLVASLPRDQCRMAVAQVPWRAHADGVVRSRLVFILWAPEATEATYRQVRQQFHALLSLLEQVYSPLISRPREEFLAAAQKGKLRKVLFKMARKSVCDVRDYLNDVAPKKLAAWMRLATVTHRP